MFVIVLLSTIVACNAVESNELRSLYGVRGGNRVTLCMNPGIKNEQCDGAIWQHNWILVRGNCVANKAMYPVIILRSSSVLCDTVNPDMMEYGYRKVLARFLHPDYPTMDFALVCVLKPYNVLEPHHNDTSASLYKLEQWLTDTFNQFSPANQRARYTPSEHNMMFSSPVKMFVTTVVLPLSFFIAFFLFVTFYTGSTKSSVSYRSLNNKEDSTFA